MGIDEAMFWIDQIQDYTAPPIGHKPGIGALLARVAMTKRRVTTMLWQHRMMDLALTLKKDLIAKATLWLFMVAQAPLLATTTALLRMTMAAVTTMSLRPSLQALSPCGWLV